MDIPDKHETLINDENLSWIADVPDSAHGHVQQLRMEAIAFDNPLKEELVDMIMRTSGTRSGRHSDRVLEAVKDQPEKEVDQDAMFQMPQGFRPSQESERGGGIGPD